MQLGKMLQGHLRCGVSLTTNPGCVTLRTSTLCCPKRFNPSQIRGTFKLTARDKSTSLRRYESSHVGRNVLLSATIIATTITASIVWNHQRSSVILNDAPPYPKEFEELVDSDDLIVWKGMHYPALDLTAADVKLRTGETSSQWVTTPYINVTRADGNRLPSNNPPEDEKSFCVANVGSVEPWKFWGVYDGHAGWATARVLRECLTPYVAKAILHARRANRDLSPEAIDNAIKAGFLKLDNEIMADGKNALKDTESHAEAISRIAPAKAGSCALLAMFDPASATLRVACAGDSRAVLGRCSSQEQQGSTKYTAEALSIDHTGFNEEEAKRIATDHPDEPDAIDKNSGRLLGMAITRAFGDHRWKWSLYDIKTCQSYFGGTAPRPKYTSPPYITAEPEVTTTKINSGDFLIMASDGLWDHMSNEDAVRCVSLWVEQKKAKKGASLPSPSSYHSDSESSSSVAPIEIEDNVKKDKWQLSYWYKGTPEHFVVEDKNAATHLIRNALGGSRRDLFCTVMSVQAPDSRNIRDDITVQVIFFGNTRSEV